MESFSCLCRLCTTYMVEPRAGRSYFLEGENGDAGTAMECMCDENRCLQYGTVYIFAVVVLVSKQA